MKFKKQSRKEYKQEIRDNACIVEDGMSYDEIAEVLGISKVEVKRIEKAALGKLQKPTEKNKILRKYHVG